MTIVTWHTGGIYEREAWRLARSCWAHRTPCLVLHLEGLSLRWGHGSHETWLSAVRQKPTVLSQAIRLVQPPLLFLDADAVLMRRLSPAEQAHVEDAGGYKAMRMRRRGSWRWDSGTITIPETRRSHTVDIHQVLWNWAANSASGGPGETEQSALQRMRPEWIGDLDPKLCAIIGEDIPDPAILHLQASREATPDLHSDEQRAERDDWIERVDRMIAEKDGVPF